ncbi:MAG: MTH938/NDUFAF3 family protein [Burkholderiaceae bacterium]
MKLHADKLPALNTVTAYGPDYVEINRERHQAPLRVMPEGSVERWEVGAFEELSAADIATLLELEPELVLIGTGERQRFLHPRVTSPLAAAHVGFETMTSHAACRTYNILMSEGRRALLALLPG